PQGGITACHPYRCMLLKLTLRITLKLFRKKVFYMHFRPVLCVCAVTLLGFPALAEEQPNRYVETHFIANRAEYKPEIAEEPKFINAWGIAIRPKGAGGHFWVTAKDISYEYVGDVRKASDETLRTLHQDKLKVVKLPVGGDDKFATGVVFSDSKDAFV